MLSGKLESFDKDDKGAIWVMGKTTVDQLSTEVEMIMKEDKYKLEKGTLQDAVYGRGNAVLRVLLGAFVPRYKFSVNITEAEGKVQLKLSKGMSGASGGVIGSSKMKKETTRLIDKIKAACNE
jgi:hypothetical protein